MANILCVVYDDPEDGYPTSYPSPCEKPEGADARASVVCAAREPSIPVRALHDVAGLPAPARGVLSALLVVGGPHLAWIGMPSAAAHPMFCGNHQEYRTPPHLDGDIYKTACAIPRRLCQSPLVQAARPHEPNLVPRTIHSTAWMTPCDFEQGRGSSDLAAAYHQTSSPPAH
jgi:hypothetical protein